MYVRTYIRMYAILLNLMFFVHVSPLAHAVTVAMMYIRTYVATVCMNPSCVGS